MQIRFFIQCYFYQVSKPKLVTLMFSLLNFVPFDNSNRVPCIFHISVVGVPSPDLRHQARQVYPAVSACVGKR